MVVLRTSIQSKLRDVIHGRNSLQTDLLPVAYVASISCNKLLTSSGATRLHPFHVRAFLMSVCERRRDSMCLTLRHYRSNQKRMGQDSNGRRAWLSTSWTTMRDWGELMSSVGFRLSLDARRRGRTSDLFIAFDSLRQLEWAGVAASSSPAIPRHVLHGPLEVDGGTRTRWRSNAKRSPSPSCRSSDTGTVLAPGCARYARRPRLTSSGCSVWSPVSRLDCQTCLFRRRNWNNFTVLVARLMRQGVQIRPRMRIRI
jgi:hypothetical protein